MCVIDENDTALLGQLMRAKQHEDADKLLVETLEGIQDIDAYLHQPPINNCTLSFTEAKNERIYQKRYLRWESGIKKTLASPQMSAFCDILVSTIFMTLISIACFLGFPVRLPWIIFFVLAIILEVLILVLLLIGICSSKNSSALKFVKSANTVVLRHICGGILAALPALAVLINFWCNTFESKKDTDMFLCILLVVSLLHFCNFTMLSSWMKSCLATVIGVVLVVLVIIGICAESPLGGTTIENVTIVYQASDAVTQITINQNVSDIQDIFDGVHPKRFEIILDIILILVLVWCLNREFEVAYRLSFHGDQQASRDRKTMQMEKEQADWLLHNIIPAHISDIIKKESRYSENHKDVGVVFAKIVNFDEFYDESFEGGKEYLRVLNEMIGDMEDLFDEEKYKDVEKIKTIGSCLMVASGLNKHSRSTNKDPYAHLYALMDFCIDLLKKLDQFNSEIFNFDFEMSIGFNSGEVVAGVIGTTKLLYDIWGDTVNVSSRMYSTGKSGRIQVTEECAKKLESMFEFEYRGQTYVKGKGDLNTYLHVKKRDGATWE